MSESRIEIVFAMNLDVLMPAFGMGVRSFSAVDSRWAAIDLDAVDRLGDSHFFEMKKEKNRDAKDALGQLVGYAMRTLTRDQGERRRIPAEEMLEAVTEKLLPEASERVRQEFGRIHRTGPLFREVLGPPSGIVHLHVVAPGVLRSTTQNLARKLINNGSVPVWLWDVRLKLSDGGAAAGYLYLRRPDFKFRAKHEVPDPHRPFRVRAALDESNSPHARRRPWFYGVASGQEADLWTPVLEGVRLHIRTGPEQAYLYLVRDTGRPGSETVERQFIGRSLLALDVPRDSISRYLLSGTGQAKSWEATLRDTLVRLQRGGGKVTEATVTFAPDTSDESLARVIHDWLDACDRVATALELAPPHRPQ